MLRILPVLLVAASLCAEDLAALQTRLGAAIDASAALDAKVKEFAKAKLLPLVGDARLAAAVAAQNARKVPLAEIQRIDQEWSAAEAELPIQKEMLGNACAEAIRAIGKDLPPLREVFAMDNQGANVGQNSLTSDYWQGDEDKWQKSYAGGVGGLDVGKPKMDKSAGAVLQQVSLPIATADGVVVGAITCGIAVDRL
jgi:hypothetical protein